MEFSKKEYNILFLAIISFILFIIIFKWINYLSNNKVIMECFSNVFNDYDYNYGDSNDNNRMFYNNAYSHTVNLPLTTTYSCKNFCGPPNRCSITGQQCSADIDCPGCQPYSPPLKGVGCGPPGNNDAGKLTWGVTPTYSPLTSGYGTHEKELNSKDFFIPGKPSFGVNTWIDSFKKEEYLFKERYQPSGLQFMPNYSKRYSLTGEFIEDGPLPSNANLTKY